MIDRHRSYIITTTHLAFGEPSSPNPPTPPSPQSVMPLLSKHPKKGQIFKAGNVRLKEHSPEAATINLEGLPGKTLILGVPGAFTPPCSEELHGFIARKADFAAAGVTAVCTFHSPLSVVS